MLARPVSVEDAPGAAALAVPRGEIAFEGVGFHYGKAGGVIEDVSLTIAKAR